MPADHKSIVWFEEVNKSDVGVVGGKGANLGEYGSKPTSRYRRALL